MESAGLVRFHLNGMFLQDSDLIVQVKFICPESLKEHILTRCSAEANHLDSATVEDRPDSNEVNQNLITVTE